MKYNYFITLHFRCVEGFWTSENIKKQNTSV